MKEKERVIENILEMELEMFLSVPSDGDSPCRHNPEGFKFHRRLQFQVWSITTLSHYQEDLIRARQNGDNLMTIKYARMQGLLPQRNANPLIDDIVRMQLNWQGDLIRRYPAIMRGARPLSASGGDEQTTSFETYIRGELETYSDITLTGLHADMSDMLARGVNASEEICRLQVEQSGFPSLAAAEAHMRKVRDGKGQ